MVGVDLNGEVKFVELLVNLYRENGFFIFQVLYDLDMVNCYCDEVFCMNCCLLCCGKFSMVLDEENLSKIYGDYLIRYFYYYLI